MRLGEEPVEDMNLQEAIEQEEDFGSHQLADNILEAKDTTKAIWITPA